MSRASEVAIEKKKNIQECIYTALELLSIHDEELTIPSGPKETRESRSEQLQNMRRFAVNKLADLIGDLINKG